MVRLTLPCLLLIVLGPIASAQPSFTRTEDVIYGRKYATALTMDVFQPKDPAKKNGAAVVYCVSGGWTSSKDWIGPWMATPFTDRGYVVFAVLHGSQPKYTIPEVLDDMHRAVRYVRANAGKYGVDPDRLGITGMSAGGHLSLMQGTAPKPGNPKAKDPVEQQPSKVAAVGCFYPPTDFLNYGSEGKPAIGDGTLTGFRPPFEFWERDKMNALHVITDPDRRKQIARAVSPVYHVSKDSAPALIVHGDADQLVPIQQAELVIAAYKKAEVPCDLVVHKGGAHGWPGQEKEFVKIADWFDKYLAKK